MRHALHFLVILAVLSCGLHLSPTEAKERFSTGGVAALYAGVGDETGHDRPNVAHACSSHCPIAVESEHNPALDVFSPIEDVLFAPPAKTLASRSQAPPIEPPAA